MPFVGGPNTHNKSKMAENNNNNNNANSKPTKPNTNSNPNPKSNPNKNRNPNRSPNPVLTVQISTIQISSILELRQIRLDQMKNKSSAVAEMGDRGNRHEPKRGGGAVPFLGALGTRLIQCGLR